MFTSKKLYVGHRSCSIASRKSYCSLFSSRTRRRPGWDVISDFGVLPANWQWEQYRQHTWDLSGGFLQLEYRPRIRPELYEQAALKRCWRGMEIDRTLAWLQPLDETNSTCDCWFERKLAAFAKALVESESNDLRIPFWSWLPRVFFLWLTLSNAFSKSTKHRNKGACFALAFSHSTRRFTRWFRVPPPGLKPACSSDNYVSTLARISSRIICSKTLLAWEPSEIVR